MIELCSKTACVAILTTNAIAIHVKSFKTGGTKQIDFKRNDALLKLSMKCSLGTPKLRSSVRKGRPRQLNGQNGLADLEVRGQKKGRLTVGVRLPLSIYECKQFYERRVKYFVQTGVC